MVFENGVKNIQAAAYNGARTVIKKSLQELANSLFKINTTLERKETNM